MGSFVWYDLETFGRDSRRGRIAQFAARRTTADLEPMGPPVNVLCRPDPDLLPSPAACLVHGITPQRAAADGLPEPEFAATVLEAFAGPDACVTGFNSLRFDDEFVRHLLYRNFHEPYSREWRDGNSRWDLIDLARLSYALRPDGIDWPLRDDGAPSFRLEHLARAVGHDHGHAHDALADVDATIAVARALRRAQPKLFDYYFRLRQKKAVAALIDLTSGTPLLHISSRYGASRGNAAVVVPLMWSPGFEQNRTKLIVAATHSDPDAWLDDDHQDLADRLFTPRDSLPEGVERPPIKALHLNKSPALVALQHVRDVELERLGIDREQAMSRAARIHAHADIRGELARVFAHSGGAATDPDCALYDGFPPAGDVALAQRFRNASADAWHTLEKQFSDARFQALAFRYRAQLAPETLDADDEARWLEFRRGRLAGQVDATEVTLADFDTEMSALRLARGMEPDVTPMLDALQAWRDAAFQRLGLL